MPKGKKPRVTPTSVETFVHTGEQRSNIPTAELETFMKDSDRVPKKMAFPRRSGLLYPRDPSGDPQLVWRGKDDQDRGPLEATAPPIYIQEKIHAKAIIDDLRKQENGEVPAQADLFSDFNGIEFEDLVDFYQHEQHWSNRLILGDSLEVMTSLAEREGLKNRVQCIYMDPPYGIKFGSNWQVSTRKRDVKDGSPTDTTRQPEQVKAFRDTWEDGIHSYLSYFRDRVDVAHRLLTSSGSLFMQMGDDNVHLVRVVLDEIFGSGNFVSQITVQKSGAATSLRLPNTTDYILWYAKDQSSLKFRSLYEPFDMRNLDTANYRWVESRDGSRRALTKDERDNPASIPADVRPFRYVTATSQGWTERGSGPVVFDGKTFLPGADRHWSVGSDGLQVLAAAGRLDTQGGTLSIRRYLDDFPVNIRNNVWLDTGRSGFGEAQLFVVQTNTKAVQRCLLMASDPGDLVLDPTCGSGTTAYVAEQWGRRWITMDTSRVALALARQRILAARFPYFEIASPGGQVAQQGRWTDLRAGFRYETVRRVMPSTIVACTEIRKEMAARAIDALIDARAERVKLFDQPVHRAGTVRVSGPFTVESLSPNVGTYTPVDDSGRVSDHPASPSTDFDAVIIANLRAAGVQNSVRNQRLTFDRLEPWPGRYIHAVGEYFEDGVRRRAAITIGPQYGTVDADLVRDAAKEVAGFFDILIVCGFAFDAYIANDFKQLGNLAIIKANMNPDLSMGGDLLKKTGTGNLFTVFGEPDIDVRRQDGRIVVEIKGLDVYDPTTGQIRAHTTADIACWFIDTAYDGSSFFVRHAYFTGAGDPYKALKAALKADVDEKTWTSLYSTVSRPFDAPASGRIAVKVINHYGDEVVRMYEMSEAKVLQLPDRQYDAQVAPTELLVAEEESDGDRS
jgi:adenine-specific DNA-methyltransferase